LTAEETVKLLDRQNTGLLGRDRREEERKHAKSTLLSLSAIKVFLETLKNCGFKPFCELDWTAVKPLDKERN